eukprot:1128590-Pelagomonas_calceolata.AAC.1
MDHRPLTCQFVVNRLPHLDVCLLTHTMKQRDNELRLIWKEDSSKKYVANLMESELVPQIFNEAIQDGNPDSAYNCLFPLSNMLLKWLT